MSTQQDPFANPKYSREQLRAMAREFLAKNEQGDLRMTNAHMRLFFQTDRPLQEQLHLIREMAK